MLHFSNHPYTEVGNIPKLVRDYLRNPETLQEFFSVPPTEDSIHRKIQERAQFPAAHRDVLCEVLRDQYVQIGMWDEVVSEHIQRLKNPKAFTITTGQQCGLLLGPVYTPMKILSAIRLCRDLKEKHPDCDFIPIFWLASEDHDIEEINHAFVEGQKLHWETSQSGAAGRLRLEGLEPLWETMYEALGSENQPNVKEWNRIVAEAYRQKSLARATQFLAHALFGEFGVLVLDPDDARLKRLFLPQMRRDLHENISMRESQKAIDALEARGYKIQLRGREVNFFYLGEGFRLRLERVGLQWKTIDGQFTWNSDAFLNELEEHPERFSPNALLRPVYQEVILPNLAYFGGAAELAYWLELKGIFDALNVSYPVVLMRHSLVWLDAINTHRLENSAMNETELWDALWEVKKRWTNAHASFDLNLAKERNALLNMLSEIEQRALGIHSSLARSAKAMSTRLDRELERFSAKLYRESRRKDQEHMQRLDRLFEAIYPGGSLQERRESIAGLYKNYGPALFSALLDAMPPWQASWILAKENH